MDHSQSQPLIAKLESIFTLTHEERQALADLPMQVQGLRTKQDIVREGDRPSRCCLLLEGFAWRETLIDGAIFREWMINIGRREAYPRACHLLCEMMTRMRAVGLAEDHTCELPVTQGELADALSITNVHANRVLQEIRKDKLISLTKKTLKVLDWEGLTRAGEFDPTYLHLENSQPAA